MQSPPLPHDEHQRLQSLQELEILDTPSEDRFDRVTRLARMMFDVPIALVSLVDGQRQWFKSKQGLAACETSRDVSFCGHAILDDEPLIVNDTMQDARFADNPLVTEDPFIRFYAGVPLANREGRLLGTLCIIDRDPRCLNDEDVSALKDLGRLAEHELQSAPQWNTGEDADAASSPMKRVNLLDQATGAWNRKGFQHILTQHLESVPEAKQAVLLAVRIPDFTNTVENWTDDGGALVMNEMAQVVRRHLGQKDVLGRVAKDTFLAFVYETDTRSSEGLGAGIVTAASKNAFLRSLMVKPEIAVHAVEPTSSPSWSEDCIAGALEAFGGGSRAA
jgi:GGDEF domain-containing protein